MQAVNRRTFLEVGIALGARGAWAKPVAAPSQFRPSEGHPLNAEDLESRAPDSVVPFRIAIPQSKLDRIVSRVHETEFPTAMGLAHSWLYGMSFSAMREIVDYWISKYDWRQAESSLNRFPQFLGQVGDLRIHFYQVQAAGPKPFPIILTHGWPGSVFEFLETIERLTAKRCSPVIPSVLRRHCGFLSLPSRSEALILW
jgi:hypothetical protein